MRVFCISQRRKQKRKEEGHALGGEGDLAARVFNVITRRSIIEGHSVWHQPTLL